MRLTAALSLCALSALLACSGERATPEGRVARTSSAIQGGVDDSTHTFAVAVSSSSETCSGTLIAPNLVLSARHCFAPSPGDLVDCKRDKFGAAQPAAKFYVTTDQISSKAKTFYRAAKIIEPPDAAFCGNDIALLILAENIPADVVTPATPSLSPRYGTKIAAVGYGITGPGKIDDGRRHTREDVALRCVPGDEKLDCNPAAYDMTARELLAGDGLCTGDSGSSAYDQESFTAGAPVALGVLSRAAETTDRCTDAIYTRTDVFAELITAAAVEAAAAGGYALPRWAGGVDPAADAGAPDAADAGPSVTPPPEEKKGCALASAPAMPDLGAMSAWIVLALLVLRRRR